MPTEIVVPNLGESIVEATVADWLKQEGERVEVGEAVVVLETDKVDLDVGAERAGVLAKIVRQSGEDVKIGDVLGVIEEAPQEGPEAPSPAPAEKAPAGEEKAPSAPSEKARAGDGRAAAPAPAAEESAPAPAAPPSEAVDRATPVARRMAEERGVPLEEIEGTGPRGRVTKEDVERHLAAAPAKTTAPAAPATPAPARPAEPARAAPPTPALLEPAQVQTRREERVRMSRRRRTIAERLVEAQRTAAMLTTFNEVDMSAVMALRKRRQDEFVKRNGVKLGISSFFVKAAVGALKAFPQVNGELQDGEILLKYYYDIGVAIGAEEGLVVPVLRDADRMSFAQIEQAIKDFAQRAAEGTLSLEDLRGGTFTITNGGVFGSLLSTPILNPPQVGILGLHKIEDRPVALNGEVVIRPMMYVALSYDHRIIDGREAVQFLVRVKELIEEPESLLLEG